MNSCASASRRGTGACCAGGRSAPIFVAVSRVRTSSGRSGVAGARSLCSHHRSRRWLQERCSGTCSEVVRRAVERAVRVARRAPPVWPRGASQWSPDRWRSRWRPRCCSPGPPGSVPMRRGRRSLLTVRLRCRRQPPPPGRQLITTAGPVATTPREPRPRATAPATLERARPTRTRARRPPAIPPRPMGAGARRATTRQRPGPTVRRPPPAQVSRTPPARLGRTPLGRSPRTPLEQPPRVVVPAAAAPAVGIPATALPDRRHRHRRPHRLL